MSNRVWKWYPAPVFRRHEGRLQQWHWGTDIAHGANMPSMTREEWLAFIPPAGIRLEWRDVPDEHGPSLDFPVEKGERCSVFSEGGRCVRRAHHEGQHWIGEYEAL